MPGNLWESTKKNNLIKSWINKIIKLGSEAIAKTKTSIEIIAQYLTSCVNETTKQ